MRRTVLGLLAACACPVLGVRHVAAGPLDRAECIVPAKPGGGFDATCKLAQAALADVQLLRQPLRISYLPGGIGAVAYNSVMKQRPADGSALVAFSSGSLLNLAQGRFGPYGHADVRWVATLGVDYGVIAVRADSPFKTLPQLLAALKADPTRIVFGAGGTIGSQDWMKAALLARAAGVGHRLMRFVAFEGGGDAMAALEGRHVHVLAGDAAEVVLQIAAGAPIKVLAVLAGRRLPGLLAAVPTAREQGYDIRWPTVRGFYVGPRVADAEYREWVEAFGKAVAAPGFAARRAAVGLFPGAMAGTELQAFVERSVAEYRALAVEFGLPVR
jgi:putative tricarboxylic transport membrane protein